MLGGADNPNGELPSYITGANTGWRRYLSTVTAAYCRRSWPLPFRN
ncbi:hypothetical protein F3179_24310 [Escherichia coli]|nr:hypothetical protein [Escherichia coli]